jgi:4-carboxymuconolactone decarboxylase
MTEVERALVRVSAALASRDKSALTSAFEEAVEIADRIEVEEVILQSYLFLGFPAALNGMAAWRRFSGTVETAPENLDCGALADRGDAVCGRVYSGQYEKLRETVRALHSDLEQWMVVEGYGKVLGRPGLSLRTRELCIVASLSVVGASKQLYSHLRGAVNVGAELSDVGEALSQADRYLDEEGRLMSRRVWDKVQQRYAN